MKQLLGFYRKEYCQPICNIQTPHALTHHIPGHVTAASLEWVHSVLVQSSGVQETSPQLAVKCQITPPVRLNSAKLRARAPEGRKNTQNINFLFIFDWLLYKIYKSIPVSISVMTRQAFDF